MTVWPTAQDGCQKSLQPPCLFRCPSSLTFYVPFISPVPQFLHLENKNNTTEGTV